MADEAYRAVFLRVHPTGKMVLSLTTEADGKEARVRAARRPTSSACRRSTSRSCPADTDRFGVGHGYNTSPSDGDAGGDRRARPAKIRDKGAAARGHGARRAAGHARVVATARGSARRPAQVKTIEDVALYAHGTGALPPGVEGGLDAQTVYRD